ncbi:Copper-exporting P-type ATPase A [Mesomycoplasma conjunctivae]|uniref:Heavy-metal transporting P-type ATPase n=1 Tax=Mesomycoplasma conjunctivae (strain ATCC 25834 / NCTC 10147 / HRC/581) TaxID=572263 RepID=C5J7E9_MESCH|nr:cation-translocating P-type ATPase [Mesomycoplasma conjunctivae]CAT05412.1 Heavy-metal transporting P-type ATPase [Mesomycoplasma conjunctivae]VEU66637.1 Copper-exporting P-type ATPase A [Mesomycoplasma conjunctivae]
MLPNASTKKDNFKFKFNIFKIVLEVSIFIYVFAIFLIKNTKNDILANITTRTTLISVLFALAIIVISLEYKYFLSYKKVFKKIITMDLLIAVASHISFIYSLVNFIIKLANKDYQHLEMEFAEVSIVLFLFFNIGKYIESKLQSKSNVGIKDLLKLKNKNSFILVDGKKQEIPTFKIKVGDLVLVPKGQSIPVDGELDSDFASLDYSSITGESLPIDFKKGDKILSGSINISDVIIIRADKKSSDSFLTQTINRLETIFEEPSKIEKVSVKIVKYLTPSILVLSILTFIVWTIVSYSIGGFEKVYPSYRGPRNSGNIAGAIYPAITVLVISCPCAFGIAAPIAIYSSSILASKNKILFANSKIYEQIIKSKFIVFDKTGTLTYGKPQVKAYQGDENYLDIAKQLAQSSNHPISKAIVDFVKTPSKIISTQEIPGKGLVYKKGDELYELISFEYVKKDYKNIEQFDFSEIGNYTVLAKNQEIVLVFLIIDKIKKDSKSIISLLKKEGFECVISSGDNEKNVGFVAQQVGITRYYGNLNPFDKEKIVSELQQEGQVIFVGDGINDILATKKASLSMSFENGSNLNNSISDVSLLKTDLSLVYKTIEIVKRTNKLVKMNFIWAIFFNSLFIPLAIAGMIFPVLAMALMFFSSTFLIINTLFFKKRNEKFLDKKIV